jgi:methionyl-tRNA synthetase
MKYYLTTPLYYVNAAPHIGHAYTTIAADVIKRYKRMMGFDAVLFTGTDEHGQKVERSAIAAGKSPVEFTDTISAAFYQEWKNLDLSIDRTIRTTDPRHHKTVQWLFERCMANGHVYKGSYTGQYCFYDELYVSEAKPGDPCPDCGRPTETVTEDNYFFRLSAFQDRLLELYEKHPEFVQPETRRNEVISFVKQGLSDLSISRTTLKWGIPLPVEGNHVFYVWFDALIGYMSAARDTDLWPADLHLIGKEIVRFHAIFWPAFLMAAELPLPERIFAHGWLLFEQDKMSKSRGNVVRAEPILQVMGADALRYFLLREIVFGQDGSFSYDALIGRYNSELANGLGNLASRTLTMINQYRGGRIPAAEPDAEIAAKATASISEVISAFDNFEFSRGLESVWSLLSTVDRFIVQQAPWKLAPLKDDAEAQARLNATLYTAAEVLRIATVLLTPAVPQSTRKIWAQLGMRIDLDTVRIDELRCGQLEPGQPIGKVEAVFPRVELKPAVERMRELDAELVARQNALLGKPAPPAVEAPAEKIPIEDFAKIDMRVGEVLSAERVKGSDKLLLLKVNIGEHEPRTLVAGIAEAYAPEQLLGRKVVIVANLQPRKLRGVTSNGMIVAASVEGGKPVLAGFHEEIPAGARLK